MGIDRGHRFQHFRWDAESFQTCHHRSGVNRIKCFLPVEREYDGAAHLLREGYLDPSPENEYRVKRTTTGPETKLRLRQTVFCASLDEPPTEESSINFVPDT